MKIICQNHCPLASNNLGCLCHARPSERNARSRNRYTLGPLTKCQNSPTVTSQGVRTPIPNSCLLLYIEDASIFFFYYNNKFDVIQIIIKVY